MNAELSRPPIAPPEPTAAVRSVHDLEGYRYRIRFRPFFFYNATAGTLPIPFLWPVTMPADGHNYLVPVTLLAFGSVVLVSAIGTWFGCRFKPTLLHWSGLRSHTFWGSTRWVSWEHILRVQPIRLPFVRYLRVYTSYGGVIWLPLFHENQQEIEKRILESAPPSNPLRRYLNESRP